MSSLSTQQQVQYRILAVLPSFENCMIGIELLCLQVCDREVCVVILMDTKTFLLFWLQQYHIYKLLKFIKNFNLLLEGVPMKSYPDHCDIKVCMFRAILLHLVTYKGMPGVGHKKNSFSQKFVISNRHILQCCTTELSSVPWTQKFPQNLGQQMFNSRPDFWKWQECGEKQGSGVALGPHACA